MGIISIEAFIDIGRYLGGNLNVKEERAKNERITSLIKLIKRERKKRKYKKFNKVYE